MTKRIEILCPCKGHTKTIELLAGSYKLRCPIKGYWFVTITKTTSFQWEIEKTDFHHQTPEKQTFLFLNNP